MDLRTTQTVLLVWGLLISPLTRADEHTSVLARPALAVIDTLSQIWDANQQLWDKVNVEQVHIAIGNMRESVNTLNLHKRQLLMELKQTRTFDQSTLDQRITSLGGEVRSFEGALNQFASAISQASSSPAQGDALRRSANELAGSKLDALFAVRRQWPDANAAAMQLQQALSDSYEILRALDCLEETLDTHHKPAQNCGFPSNALARGSASK